MNENPPPTSHCEPTFKAHNRITTSQTATITKSKHKVQTLATPTKLPTLNQNTAKMPTYPPLQLTGNPNQHIDIMTKDPHQEPNRKRERETLIGHP